ncbi:unnamed protein product [Urochloa humidicola]
MLSSSDKYRVLQLGAVTSFHARMTDHEETLRRDVLKIQNENNARIMERYEAHISQLKDDGSKLKEELENERAGTRILEERTRISEERLQRVLEYEREAAEKIRILEEKLQIAQSFESQNRSLEEEIEIVRAGNKALTSTILKTLSEVTTLKKYSDMLVSDKIDLENKVDHLTKELENSKKEHARTVSLFKDVARVVRQELGDDPH